MNEQTLRAVAAVCAVCVFCYPFVWPLFTELWATIRAPRASDPTKQKMQDIQAMLELSARFSAAGSKEGVDLCQKLIDALLKQAK